VPRFNVNVTFSLRTMVEPEGIRFDHNNDAVTDLEDQSYFRSNEIDADGGAISFECECETEDDAEAISEEIVYDGMEVEDDAGFTWVVDDRSVEVEKVEIPMDAERAKLLVTDFIDSMEGMDDELKLAFGFLLELVSLQREDILRLEGRVTDHRSEITRLDSVVARQAGEIDRLTAGPDGSEAPGEVVGYESN
jgi:hypothetical protein